MTQQKQLEYAIIGGGIAGLSLAIALLKRGVRLTIYEQAPRFGEIGAGVSFSPNAIRAMKECDASIYEGFRKVATHNAWESKRNHFFDYVDGYHAVEKHLFTLASDEGANSVHRAAFLDELVKVIPDELCRCVLMLSRLCGDPFADGADVSGLVSIWIMWLRHRTAAWR